MLLNAGSPGKQHSHAQLNKAEHKF